MEIPEEFSTVSSRNFLFENDIFWSLVIKDTVVVGKLSENETCFFVV